MRLLAIAALALVAFFAVYEVAVQTDTGRRGDQAALTGGSSVPLRAKSAADRLLGLVSVASLAAVGTTLLVLAVLRRRPRLIVLPAVIVGASLIGTELFKRAIFSRPDLIANTYPSGHTTVAISLGLSVVLVVPHRTRGMVAIAAALFAGTVGVLAVTADLHRPSDTLGSYALTLAITAAMVAVLCAWNPTAWARRRESFPEFPSAMLLERRVEVAAIAVGITLFTAGALMAGLRYGHDVGWNRPHAAFLLSVGGIVAASGLTVGALLRALPDPLTEDYRDP